MGRPIPRRHHRAASDAGRTSPAHVNTYYRIIVHVVVLGTIAKLRLHVTFTVHSYIILLCTLRGYILQLSIISKLTNKYLLKR